MSKKKIRNKGLKKELLKSDVEYEVVLIDATESPIERPKKNKNIFTQERRKDIR